MLENIVAEFILEINLFLWIPAILFNNNFKKNSLSMFLWDRKHFFGLEIAPLDPAGRFLDEGAPV